MTRVFRIVALALLMTVLAQGAWAAEKTPSRSFLDSVVQAFVAVFDQSELGPLSDPNGGEVSLGPLADPNGDEVTINPTSSHLGDEPELGPLADPNG